MIRLDDILDEIQTYNPEADLDAVRSAYVFIAHLHQGKERVSGEAYLSHPLEIAHILAQLKMDVATVITGLLHDVVEESLVSLEEVETQFGREVAELIDRVTRISRISLKAAREDQSESFRKMLVAMARDLRVILVRLADRLHNMRTLEASAGEESQRYAQETLEIYAPLANRLGISWVKSELENLSFCHLHQQACNDLQARIEGKKRERKTYIEEVRSQILDHLREQVIDGEVSGRFKHLYSVHLKMEKQQIDFDQVFDLIAFRVLVHSVRDCYAVLGLIHEVWKPVPGRFKDYIAMPKSNGYQSLHTTVIGPYGERMEVQIRTKEMHRIAEEGIAAHWKYKEGGGKAQTDKQFRWLRQLLEWQQEIKDSRELVDVVQIDIFPEEVYVFTPGGEVKELPKGSSPIDFAYAVHTDVGSRCTGARVNGKLVPLKTVLQNGDSVEIITSGNQRPSKDWLKYVRTSKARNKIRNWVKAEEREKSIELGRELLDKEVRKHGLSLKRLLASKEFTAAVQELGFKAEDDILASVGYGKLTPGQVVSRAVPRESLKAEKPKKSRIGKVIEKIRRKPASAIRVQGIDDILVRFAKCCNPLPGDPVIGYITRGRGVTVHTGDCSHLLNEDPERRIDVEWDMQKRTTRSIRIRVVCDDQKGALANITRVITDCEANITSANVQSMADGKGVNVFGVDVQNLEHLNRVIQAVRKVKGVHKVDRMRH